MTLPPDEAARVRHLAAAAGRRATRRAVGRRSPTARWRWSPPTMSRIASRSRSSRWHESFDRISQRRAGHRDAAGDGLRRGRGASAGSPSSGMVDLLSTTPARLFGLRGKGAVEVGRDADLVLFDPEATRTIRADLHHTSDYTPYEGREVVGAVRSIDRARRLRRPGWRLRRYAAATAASSSGSSTRWPERRQMVNRSRPGNAGRLASRSGRHDAPPGRHRRWWLRWPVRCQGPRR